MIGKMVTFWNIFGEPTEGLVVEEYNNILCIETDDDLLEITREQVIYY